MAKPMTSEEIEAELEALENTIEPSSVRTFEALRAAFTLGQDNGQAIILERAESLIAPRFVDEKTSALGAALVAIMAWCALVAERSWSTGKDCVMLFAHGEEAPISESGAHRVRFCYGADQAEAITVAATWCTEHMKNSVPKVPDTMPAPPDEAFESLELAGKTFPGCIDP